MLRSHTANVLTLATICSLDNENDKMLMRLLLIVEMHLAGGTARRLRRRRAQQDRSKTSGNPSAMSRQRVKRRRAQSDRGAKRDVKVRLESTDAKPLKLNETMLTASMRTQGNAARSLLRARERESPKWAKIVKRMSCFFIPGGHASTRAKGTSIQVYMDMFDEMLLGDFRAAPTWERYFGPWMEARVFIQSHMEKDGYSFCAKELEQHQEYVLAAAMDRYLRNPAISAVEVSFAAQHMALRMNGIKVSDNFYRKVLLDVCKRQRSKEVKKSAGLTLKQVKQFAKGYGRSKCLAERCVAVFVKIAFLRCLRWADAMVVMANAIYRMGKHGALICIPRRKNAQYTTEWFPLPDTGSKTCAVRQLRELMTDLGFVVPKQGWGKEKRFIFPEFTSKRGKSHPGKQEFTYYDGYFACGKRAYPKWNRLFRKGLGDNCGIKDKDEQKEYGLQSMRSGGDTHLWNKGVSAEERRDIGGWATPSVERSYLRKRLKDSLKFSKFYDF